MKNKHADDVPKFHEFFNPTIGALKELGGQARNNEIEKKVIKIMDLTEKQVQFTYDNRDISIVLNRIGFSLSWLKTGNILESGGRSIWVLKNKKQEEIDPLKFRSEYSKIINEKKKKREEEAKTNTDSDVEDITEKDFEEDLDEELLKKIKNINPYDFEKLSRNLLRKMDLIEVEVTQQTNDGGIDGTGILKINDLLSFHINFQCKRYKGIVGRRAIAEFRGSMKSQVERGIFITTGTFSPNAKKEALDLGKGTTIDLIDGEELIEKMKEFSIGVKTEQVLNIISIDDSYFENL